MASKPPEQMPPNVLDIYKTYVADLGNVGARYATENGFYLSVISALLAILGYMSKDPSLSAHGVFLNVLIALFACVVCWLWRRTILFYRGLFAVKFQVIRDIEQAMAVRPYTEENVSLESKHVSRLTDNEARVPIAMLLLFIVLIVVAIVSM